MKVFAFGGGGDIGLVEVNCKLQVSMVTPWYGGEPHLMFKILSSELCVYS